jgi:hypothetical protein
MASLTTPKGKAVWPWINKADFKFNEAGVYSCRLHVDQDEFNTFKRKIDEQIDREFDEACKVAGKKITRAASQPLRQSDDGDWEIFAKQNASRVTKDGKKLDFVIPVFDSKGQKIKNSPDIGSGSILRMSVEPYSWHVPSMGFGYTLRLKGVQNGVILEAKGRFISSDRTKHLLIKEQHPEYDIRFVFQRAANRLNSRSKTTYGAWCDRHGFLWCEEKIPKEWLL